MIEVLAAPVPTSPGPLSRIAKHLVLKGAQHLLDWQPNGSIIIECPDRQRLRFGMPKNGENEPVLKLNNYKVLLKAMRRGTIGFAEAYIDQDIECHDLVGLFNFFVRNRENLLHAGNGFFDVRLVDRLGHALRRNSRKGSRKNISEHYDLGNAFYRHWLDQDMTYSSGLYGPGIETLEDAQHEKYRLIASLLNLTQGDHVLEIGCGWGAFAQMAAQHYGANVAGLTLSSEQLNHAQEQTRKRGLQDALTFRLQDYRDVRGQYEKIVSIEMVEAVGANYWQEYFDILRDRLTPGGVAVLQAITINEAYYATYQKHPDFIQRYIFPGGMLPTPEHIFHHANKAGFELDYVHQFGQSYATTLREWRRRFELTWPKIEDLGFDKAFRRKWRYYLAYCEAGFLTNMIDVGVYRLRKAE